MRVAVIDDEPLAREGVLTRLARHTDLHVVGEYHDAPSAIAGLAAATADLTFVDVQMPGVTGLDLLAAIPEAQRPLVILLTAHDSFAIRAFELHVIDYLLKPIDDERFADALDRARQAFRHRARDRAAADGSLMPSHQATIYPQRFTVRLGQRLLFVDVAEIDWIEADGSYAALHVGAQVHLVREPLHRLATRLDPACFMRVHRSAIVRVDRVSELRPLANRDAMLRLRDGTPLRASRTYAEALQKVLQGGSISGE
ncbi:LytR/AlgR family response regulator transcription factor [Dyella subtropica]|uniref:LytR/AlgR family response regulator transcription factor n=1 Tax=Dyella subtropica TaxID=2992127 RepID=UPI0022511D52|nr:LytTR family DNA-binding domain-containing protein [Dyella subtropica]